MKSEANLVKPLTWYATGVFALGAGVGLLSGLSNSPVVATLLPLLFGLVAGTGGVYFTTAKLDSESARWRLERFGQGLLGFVAFCLVGVWLGSSIRLGTSPFGFGDARDFGSDALIESARDAAESIDLMVLRTQLRLVGANPAEARQVLAQIAEDAAKLDEEPSQPAAEFDTAMTAIEGAVRALRMIDTAGWDADLRAAVDGAADRLEGAAADIGFLRQSVSADRQLSFYLATLEDIGRALIALNEAASDGLRKNAEARRTVRFLEGFVEKESMLEYSTAPRPRLEVSKERLRALLELLAGAEDFRLPTSGPSRGLAESRASAGDRLDG